MAYIGLNQVSLFDTMTPSVQIPAILSSLLLFGSYPMTQIYQHEEDARRGDKTLSLKLGIQGLSYLPEYSSLLRVWVFSCSMSISTRCITACIF